VIRDLPLLASSLAQQAAAATAMLRDNKRVAIAGIDTRR